MQCYSFAEDELRQGGAGHFWLGRRRGPNHDARAPPQVCRLCGVQAGQALLHKCRVCLGKAGFFSMFTFDRLVFIKPCAANFERHAGNTPVVLKHATPIEIGCKQALQQRWRQRG